MNQIEPLKPLKTWSHLATRRRKPSEYEIVSTNLHWLHDRFPRHLGAYAKRATGEKFLINPTKG